MASEQKFAYYENLSGQTIVLGTKHPNVNLWLIPGIVLKLTTDEIEASDLKKHAAFKEVTDAKRIKNSIRPDEAKQDMVNKKFAPPAKETDEEKKKSDPGGFDNKPTLAKDPLSFAEVNKL